VLGGLRNVLNSDRDMAKSNWHFVKIDEIKSNDQSSIAIGPFGSRMTADLYRPSGVPVIRGTNISSAKSFEGDFVYISEETANDLKSCLVYPDDLVFPHRGAIGLVGIVPRDGYCKYILSSSLMKLSCNKKIADPYFLFYFFRSPIGKYELLKNSSTVGTPGIATPLTSLKNIELHIPPLPTQKAIAHILGTLDDKIELNRRMNETLESIARAIFTSWFIDFDPVRAKAEGRQPEGMDAATAALFPSEFETVEGQEIPKGWSVSNIYEISDVVYGQPYSSKLFTSEQIGYPLIRIRDLKTNAPDYYTDEKLEGEILINPGDIIVGMDGEFRAYFWMGPISLLNQRLCKFVPKLGVSSFFVYESIKYPLSFFETSKVGTTVIHLGKGDIDTFKVVIPSKEILLVFGSMSNNILKSIISNSQENRSLTNIRDTLLPKLLSGELPITNPEQFTSVS